VREARGNLMLRRAQLADILAAGVVAGTLDITYACAYWGIKVGVPPRRIFQSVAAGLLGPASFTGGLASSLLGLLLHFTIAITMALVYYLAARRLRLLVRRPIAGGASYGLVLYVVMNYIVVPLSAAGGGAKDPLWITLSVVVHMFLIGVPIALITQAGIALPPKMEGFGEA
jgi:uncharacterized membrane protein YagU involved in acid resistance